MNQWALFPLGKTHDAQLKEYIKESATHSKLRFGAGYLAGDLGFGILVFFHSLRSWMPFLSFISIAKCGGMSNDSFLLFFISIWRFPIKQS